MTNLKKISTTLSIASAFLLGACSSGGSDSDSDDELEATPNTKAPQLIANWQTACTILTQGTSTTTGASGSGGSVSGGDSFIATANFTQDGHFELNTEFFASTDCNSNTSNGFSNFEGIYLIGDASLANDGSDVTNIDISDSESTTFTIFQTINGINLFLGNQGESSADTDGTKATTRFDGLGTARYIKQ